MKLMIASLLLILGAIPGLMNFLPGTGTEVVLNGESRGSVEGDDFFSALLLVWIGDKPADANLKKGILGQ